MRYFRLQLAYVHFIEGHLSTLYPLEKTGVVLEDSECHRQSLIRVNVILCLPNFCISCVVDFQKPTSKVFIQASFFTLKPSAEQQFLPAQRRTITPNGKSVRH